MRKLFGRRQPVKREGIDKYLRLMLVSFAISVIGTRLFLSLSGYPQLGGGGLHIAHVLWGGLVLFLGSLLPLILANRWALTLSAIFSGAGMGLFIDEVGKFITQNNDYFYPPAAPIIYAVFVMTVLAYNNLKREPSRDPRSELYRSLDAMEEILDSDLEEDEKRKLLKRLDRIVVRAKDSSLAKLAEGLIEYIRHQETVVDETDLIDKIRDNVNRVEKKYLGRRLTLAVLIVGLILAGINSLFDFFVLSRQLLTGSDINALINEIISSGRIVSDRSFPWFVLRVILEAVVGVVFLRSARLMLDGRERKALKYSNLALLVSLTVINIFIFYFDQFRAVVDSLLQFALLTVIVRYRSLYLNQEMAEVEP